jgi:chromosome segregation ATPase
LLAFDSVFGSLTLIDSQLAEKIGTSKVDKPLPDSTTPSNLSNISTMRTDLASAQQARTQLETRLTTFTKLQKDYQSQSSLVEAQNREITALQRKLQDRDAEISEGKRINEQTHDELVSINLQFNLSEQRNTQLETENKELVDRWMKKMREEADDMNEQSKW